MEQTTNLNETMATSDNLLNRLIDAEVELAKAKAELNEKEKALVNSERELYGEFYEALAQAQSQFEKPRKSKTAKVVTKNGGTYSYDYSTLSDLLDAAEPALNANGIFFSQEETHLAQGDQIFVSVVTILGYKNGLEIKSQSLPLKYNAFDPQSARSTVSYLRRYGASNVLGIEPEEEGSDDGNYAQGTNFQVHNKAKQADRGGIPHKASQGNYSASPNGQNRPSQSPMNARNANAAREQSKPSAKGQVANKPAQQPSDSGKEVTKMEQAPTTVNKTANQPTAVKMSQKSQENTEHMASHSGRSEVEILERGLVAAKSLGATDEQIAKWEAVEDKKSAIAEIRDFCIAVQNGNGKTEEL